MSNRIKRKLWMRRKLPVNARQSAKWALSICFSLVTGEHQGKSRHGLFFLGTSARDSPPVRFAAYGSPATGEGGIRRAENPHRLDGVMVYQETYHGATYAKHHLKGKKQDCAFCVAADTL